MADPSAAVVFMSVSALFLVAPVAGIAVFTAGTPPMGFSTWNSFRCGFDASVLRQTAALMVSSGLRDSGYVYLNMDDCWMLSGANRTHNGTGPQVADPAKFPANDTLPMLIAHVHSLNLKFGLYTARSRTTCQRLAGSCQHEEVDAAAWSAMGVDYVKDDSCGRCRTNSSGEALVWPVSFWTGRC